MKSLLVRVVTKAVALLLRYRTVGLRFFISDPTKILLDFETPSQTEAREGRQVSQVSKEPRTLVVVIPFRDRVHLTSACLQSLLRQKIPAPWSLRIVLVDHASTEPATRSWIQEIKNKNIADFLEVKGPYNFSRMNHLAVESLEPMPEGSAVCFLNNDVVLDQEDSLSQLLLFLDQTENVGALGCTLLYPDGKIQHLFAAPGVKIVAAHPLKNLRPNLSWKWFESPRPVAAVTGALLMMKLADYKKCGGFDHELPTLGQDIDLCLKLQEMGKVNWVLPHVFATHHEGKTKAHGFAWDEVERVYAKWENFLVYNPFYSSKFSRWSEFPVLSCGEAKYPWKMLRN